MKPIAFTLILLSLIAVGWIPKADSQVYDYERESILSRIQRDGKDTNDYREIGEAEVTESSHFPNGIHLESKEQDAMAVAVYLMEVDPKTSSLAIRVGYRGTGRIFVRDMDADGATGVGVTFELPAEQERMTFHLAAQRYVGDENTVELHAVATDQKTLDIEYIDVEGLRYKPQVRIVERYRSLPEPWHHSSYWYYYTGPVYTLSYPYHYVLYDNWWIDDWYLGWRAGIHLRLRHYPIRYYSYSWWPWHRHYSYYHYPYYPLPRRVYVNRLPKSRRGAYYKGTRRRRHASRSRLAGMAPRLERSGRQQLDTSQTNSPRRSPASNARQSAQRSRNTSITRRSGSRNGYSTRSRSAVTQQRSRSRFSTERQQNFGRSVRSSSTRSRSTVTQRRSYSQQRSYPQQRTTSRSRFESYPTRSRSAVSRQRSNVSRSQYTAPPRRQSDFRSRSVRSYNSRANRAPSVTPQRRRSTPSINRSYSRSRSEQSSRPSRTTRQRRR